MLILNFLDLRKTLFPPLKTSLALYYAVHLQGKIFIGIKPQEARRGGMAELGGGGGGVPNCTERHETS
jgi:hypothetical protein